MTDATFWAAADRHLIRYGASFSPRIIARAQGSYVFDEQGRAILDFTSGQMSAVELHLCAEEGAAELPECVLQPGYQCVLEFALGGVLVKAEEVEHVWVLEDLTRLVRVLGIQVDRKVVGCGPGARSQVGGDVMLEDLPRPTTPRSLVGIPLASGRFLQLQQDGDLTQGNRPTPRSRNAGTLNYDPDQGLKSPRVR